jgi:hypothetical protein
LAAIKLKRGFKAEAERISTKLREEVGVHPCAKLCAFELAKHLKLEIYQATDFIKDEKGLSLLEGVNGFKNELKASKLWRKHVGGRFPEGKDEKQNTSTKAAAAAVGAATSFPWAI